VLQYKHTNLMCPCGDNEETLNREWQGTIWPLDTFSGSILCGESLGMRPTNLAMTLHWMTFHRYTKKSKVANSSVMHHSGNNFGHSHYCYCCLALSTSENLYIKITSESGNRDICRKASWNPENNSLVWKNSDCKYRGSSWIWYLF